jgi:hypothetical protein
VTIRVECPSCHQDFTMSDKVAGKRTTCPVCDHPFTVPGPRNKVGLPTSPTSVQVDCESHPTHKRPRKQILWELPRLQEKLSQESTGIASLSAELFAPSTAWKMISQHLLEEPVQGTQKDWGIGEQRNALARIAAYADGIPHHGIVAFGKELEIKYVYEIPLFLFTLDTIVESRELERRVTSYKGWIIPTRCIYEETVNVWSYKFEPPHEDSPQDIEWRLDESQEVFSCDRCVGEGKVECGTCRGKRETDCPTCKGGGEHSCPTCFGSRTEKLQRTIKVPQTCASCRFAAVLRVPSDRRAPCIICAGSGIEFINRTEYFERVCLRCSGNGQVRCSTCTGRGQVVCPTCGGQGNLKCELCEGSGEVVRFLCLCRHFKKFSLSRIAFLSILPASAGADLPASEFHRILKVACLDFRESIPSEKLGELGQGLAEFTSRSTCDLLGKGKVSKQRLIIRKATISRLIYRYEKKSYELLLCGKAGRVIAATSPITEAARELAESSVELWQHGNRREAAIAYRKCIEMGEADAHCKSAIEDIDEQLPEGLSTASMKVMSFERILALGVALGLSLMGLALYLLFHAAPLLVAFAGAGLVAVLIAMFYFRY